MVIKVGYLGPDPVTFGYMAAEQYFNGHTEVEFIPFRSHEKICEAVGDQEIDYGTVAVENVIDGIVNETVRAVQDYDSLYGLSICGETAIPINLYYLRKEKSEEPPIKILSHPVAIRQCSQFLTPFREKGVLIEAVDSTGEAARETSKNPTLAVIASEKAEALGLSRILPQSVADRDDDITRFWILGKRYAKQVPNQVRYRTCFLINLRQNQAGALKRSLDCFANNEINMLVVYPIPIPGNPWEYTFLVEFSGHIDELPMKQAWKILRDSGLCLSPPQMLGSYPDVTSPN